MDKPTVSRPFIDKISLVYDCDEGTGERLRLWARNLQDGSVYRLRYVGAMYRGERYRYNWELYLDNSSRDFVLIRMHSYDTNTSYLKLEWNPRRLGSAMNQQLWEFLQLLLVDEYEPFLNSAIVTRIDIAVDLSPITPDAIWIESTCLTKGDIRTGGYGALHSVEYLPVQTINLGDRGSRTSFCIYCRNPDTGERISTTNPFVTRIEAHVKPRCILHNMWEIENPFDRLTIVRSIDNFDLRSVSDMQRLFVSSCRSIGLHGTLRLIRETRARDSLRDWINQHLETDWFDAEEIWSRYSLALAKLKVPDFVRLPDWREVDNQWIRVRRRAA